MKTLFGRSRLEQLDSMKEHKTRELSKPLLIAAALLGAAVLAGGMYRYMRPHYRRPAYKSRSRKPQISRWENEGGDVPQVQAVSPRTEH